MRHHPFFLTAIVLFCCLLGFNLFGQNKDVTVKKLKVKTTDGNIKHIKVHADEGWPTGISSVWLDDKKTWYEATLVINDTKTDASIFALIIGLRADADNDGNPDKVDGLPDEAEATFIDRELIIESDGTIHLMTWNQIAYARTNKNWNIVVMDKSRFTDEMRKDTNNYVLGD